MKKKLKLFIEKKNIGNENNIMSAKVKAKLFVEIYI